MQTLYRYEDRSGTVLLREFPVDRLTPCGTWIRTGCGNWVPGKTGLEYKADLKFVNLRAEKKFACPTKEAAEVSFYARKRRQLAILRAQVAYVEQAVGREHYYYFGLDL